MQSSSPFALEIACFSLEGVLTAIKNGAHRIELCENPMEGGTTPSYGTLKKVRDLATIPVFPIIRSRGGHFYFNEDDTEVMKNDINLCKTLCYEGVVVGFLNQDGTVATETLKRIVELAYPLDVTFHRAFDRCRDPFEALESIIECGCQRILTSGLKPTAPEGAALIATLVVQAAGRIIIMPGSGVRCENVKMLAETTGAEEFHTAARKVWVDASVFQPDSMEESLPLTTVDGNEVKSILTNLNAYFEKFRKD